MGYTHIPEEETRPSGVGSSPYTSNGSPRSSSNSVLSYDGTAMLFGDYPDSGLEVLIVGAGLAGLTAAIECVRKGHSVRVLERGADINTMGKYWLFHSLGLTATADI
jgi:NADPH-dependent 2,4-dienoyl-CoA reductase/sulfur reductase-like enzyme